MRKNGYYWVILNTEWVIARWSENGGKHGGVFFVEGKPYYQNQFDRIDESQIKR
jgi:hypothetical protein